MKEEKPYIEILRGQLVGAEQSMEECRELKSKAEADYMASVDYYRECKQRYENMLNENQNTNGNN